MSTLVFIYTLPLSRSPAEKAGIDYLVSQGFSVQIWDLSILYYSQEAIEGYFAGSSSHSYANPLVPIIKVLSRQHFSSLLVSSRSCKFLFATFDTGDTYWILRLFRKHGISYFLGYLWPPYPFDDVERRPQDSPLMRAISDPFVSTLAFLQSISCICASKTPIGAYLWLLDRFKLLVKQCLLRFTSYYQKPAALFTSGTEGLKHWSDRFKSSPVFSVDSTDLLFAKPSRIIQHDYIVFVDDAVCYSPDKALSLRPTSNCDDYPGYLSRMEALFDFLEENLSLKIVIGASSKYQYSSPELCRRPIYYGLTRELIYYSRYVLAHGSSATFQAAFSRKPVCIITDQSFSKPKKAQAVSLARMFQAYPVFSHEHADVRNRLESDSATSSYGEFVRKYLVSPNSRGSYLEALSGYVSNANADG